MDRFSSAQIILTGYAFLLIAGGIIGYRKAGSRPSLIAGTISGLLTLAAVGIAMVDTRGIWLGLGIAASMLVVFSIRLAKTRKFMPSGMLLVASLLVLGLVLAAIP